MEVSWSPLLLRVLFASLKFGVPYHLHKTRDFLFFVLPISLRTFLAFYFPSGIMVPSPTSLFKKRAQAMIDVL